MTDNWVQKVEFFSEKEAQREFTWLNNHSVIREYILISVTTPEDILDDVIPL